MWIAWKHPSTPIARSGPEPYMYAFGENQHVSELLVSFKKRTHLENIKIEFCFDFLSVGRNSARKMWIRGYNPI